MRRVVEGRGSDVARTEAKLRLDGKGDCAFLSRAMTLQVLVTKKLVNHCKARTYLQPWAIDYFKVNNNLCNFS